jgi:hypothetical protein
MSLRRDIDPTRAFRCDPEAIRSVQHAFPPSFSADDAGRAPPRVAPVAGHDQSTFPRRLWRRLMKHRLLAASLLACLPGAIATPALASSHREAPFITEHPKVDGTDFYLFRSYEGGREDFVTLIANYLPLQDAYGGPNYFTLDPEALYEIHIDNTGDAIEDLTFQFRFTNAYQNAAIPVGGVMVPVPLLALNRITGATPESQDGVKNLIETYSVGVVSGPRRASAPQLASNPTDASTTFRKPLDNIGEKTFATYSAYADSHVFPIAIPGCATNGRVFAGQRRDGFRIPLGEVFDLINLNPLGAANGIAAQDDVGDKNVTSIALELPISCIVSGPSQPIIGGWTSASLRRARTLNATPGGTSSVPGSAGPGAAVEGGGFVQVSRLGTPLINEVVIGLGDKDRFNGSEPRNDGQFATYVTNPTLPELIEILFGVQAPDVFPRTDLIAAALTGVAGLNQPPGVVASEMLRLNTSTPVTAAVGQNRLGVIAGDSAGFPNGRRPGDDVVDILLRVMMGVLLPPPQAPGGALPLVDGVEVNAAQFRPGFPYLQTPVPGATGVIP